MEKDYSEMRNSLKNTCIMIVPSLTVSESSRTVFCTFTWDKFLALCQYFEIVSSEPSSQSHSDNKKFSCAATQTERSPETHGMDEKGRCQCICEQKRQTCDADSSHKISEQNTAKRLHSPQSFRRACSESRHHFKRSSTPSLRSHNVKQLLSTFPDRFEQVALKEFAGVGSYSDMLKFSPMKYLSHHITLLLEFIRVVKTSHRCLVDALEAYLRHLRILTDEFDTSPSAEVIQSDLNVLDKVRKYGGWEFAQARKYVHEERKKERNAAATLTKSTDHDAKRMTRKVSFECTTSSASSTDKDKSLLAGDRPVNLKENTVKESDHNNKHVEAHESTSEGVKDAATHRGLDVDSEDRDEKQQHATAKNSLQKETSTEHGPGRPTTRSHPQDARISREQKPSQQRSSIATEKKRIETNPKVSATKKRRRPCRFYNNVGGCRKGDTCDFPHVCSNCESPQHNCFRCPAVDTRLPQYLYGPPEKRGRHHY